MSTATAVRERPILLSRPMVRATREGRKTQTRRVVKPQPEHWRCQAPGAEDIGGLSWKGRCYEADSSEDIETACPYGVPGDRLWVRETWWSNDGWEPHRERAALFRNWDGATHTQVGRTGGPAVVQGDPSDEALKAAGWVKRPSIHMPRWASRILLEITEVRVERLCSISEADAMAEGCVKVRESCYVFRGVGYDTAGLCHSSPAIAFACLWDEINTRPGVRWEDDPWVWAIGFRVLEGLA